MTLTLKPSQKGNRVSGACFSGMRFGNKIDESDFSTVIKDKIAEFELESMHGGNVMVRLTKGVNRLYPPNVLRIRVARRSNKTSPEGESRHTILC
jgi:hypothetical protein